MEDINFIKEAKLFWKKLIKVTDAHIQPSHLGITEDSFHCENYKKDVDDKVDWVKNR